MKRNFTIAFKAWYALLFTLILSHTASSQCQTPELSFEFPVLYSGTDGQVNATYKFSSVMNGVDAYVKIEKLVGGASLAQIDNTTTGYSAAWQPVVNTPSSQLSGDSYISWSIQFKNSSDNSLHTFPCFSLSAIDIDGNGSNLREFIESKGYDSYNPSIPTLLELFESGDSLKALGSLINFPGIDTSAWSTNVNYQYSNKNTLYVKTGIHISNNDGYSDEMRYNCIFFKHINIVGGLLPVKYTSFDALVNDKSVLLKWTTEQEINNDHFEVERSFNGHDFSTIGLVLDAQSTAGTTKSYMFKDNSPELSNKSVIYYRLKQINYNGTYAYSSVLAVKLESKNGITLQVSPNPFIDKLTIRFASKENGNAEIRIINMTGQPVLTKQSTISKGFNNIQIDGLVRLANGTYITELLMNGIVIDRQKVIKN